MSVKRSLTNKGDEKVTVEAIELHRKMVSKESRGAGDTDNAMRRLETDYGLDYWAQWICRYRRECSLEFAHRIHWTWRAMLERSVVSDLDALGEIPTEGTGDDDPELQGLLAQAKSLLAEIAARKAKVK